MSAGRSPRPGPAGALAGLFLVAAAASAQPILDFGELVEALLHDQARSLFGVQAPLANSAPAVTGPYRRPGQGAADQLALARGLRVRYVTRQAANFTDQMVLFPPGAPSHLITCVEGPRAEIGVFPDGRPKLNPSVQRIHLGSGAVATILRGMAHCDGIRLTPWRTILATEETADGGAYEILKPLVTSEHSVVSRGTGEVRDAAGRIATRVAKRPALPTIAWEGIAISRRGVIIAGDELRPGTTAEDADGGTLYKFVPSRPYAGGGIGGDLARSPLAGGAVFALQIGCTAGGETYGQGCEVGAGNWLEVNAATARQDADARRATGYYRPEDLQLDPRFTPPPDEPSAIRWCWTNSGNAAAFHYSEVVCGVDREPDAARSAVVVNRFLEGDPSFNSFDNLEFHPTRAQLWVLEDDANGDVFACLADGRDRDIKSDGCIRVASVKDSSAEPTGLLFSNDGRRAYLSIQHSDDTHMPAVDGYPTDDVLVIEGL